MSSLAGVAEHVSSGEPAVVLFDQSDCDWLRKVSDLTKSHPSALPIMLADCDNDEEFILAVSAGVAGFCSPDASASAILRTVEAVTRTGAAIPRDRVPALVVHVRHGRGHQVRTAAGPVDVTDREWDILQLLVQRRSTKEMADALYVSVGTVRSHISALLKKLGAIDRDEAIAHVEQDRDRSPM